MDRPEEAEQLIRSEKKVDLLGGVENSEHLKDFYRLKILSGGHGGCPEVLRGQRGGRGSADNVSNAVGEIRRTYLKPS